MINKFRLQRWLNRISIPNLMTYVVGCMGVAFVLQMAGVNVYGLLSLTRSGVLRGELWRLVTFAVLPPSSSLMWILFSLYFYWMIGSALENQWGSSRFTLFYLTGAVGSIIAGLIGGRADNTYLNLSLFLAYAAMNPNRQLMMFFFIPVKVKYLALIDLALYLYMFIMGGWSVRLMILVALGNVILFLGGDLLNAIRQEARYFKTRQNFRRAMRGR